MFDTLFGWYAKNSLGCKFDNIVFSESIAANTEETVSLTDAQDGERKKNKLTGSDFIITGIYSVCTTGVVDVKVLPDNDVDGKFYLQPYQPLSKKLPVPLHLTADLVAVFTNSEARINDVYIAFDGFWIPEGKMPHFTLLSELIPTALLNIDLQTYAMQSIMEATAVAEGVTEPPEGWGITLPPPEEYREFCKRQGRF